MGLVEHGSKSFRVVGSQILELEPWRGAVVLDDFPFVVRGTGVGVRRVLAEIAESLEADLKKTCTGCLRSSR